MLMALVVIECSIDVAEGWVSIGDINDSMLCTEEVVPVVDDGDKE